VHMCIYRILVLHSSSDVSAPTALANCPPLSHVISMLCMIVPKGISVEVDSSFS
jgi:hypothetical protein